MSSHHQQRSYQQGIIEQYAIPNDIALAIASSALAVEVVAVGLAVSEFIERNAREKELEVALSEAEVQVAERSRIITARNAEKEAAAAAKQAEREKIESRIAAAREEELRVQRNQEIALERDAEKNKEKLEATR